MIFLASSLTNVKLTSVLKILIQPVFWALIASFLLLGFTSVVLNSWPYVLFSTSISIPLLVIAILSFILVLIWNIFKKLTTHRFSKLLFGTKIVLILIVLQTIFTSFVIGVRPSKEIATASMNDIEYHLVYSSGCIESCSNTLRLYRCDSLKLACPSIDFKDYPYFYDGRSQQLPFDINIVSLDIDKVNGRVYLLDVNKSVVANLKMS